MNASSKGTFVPSAEIAIGPPAMMHQYYTAPHAVHVDMQAATGHAPLSLGNAWNSTPGTLKTHSHSFHLWSHGCGKPHRQVDKGLQS